MILFVLYSSFFVLDCFCNISENVRDFIFVLIFCYCVIILIEQLYFIVVYQVLIFNVIFFFNYKYYCLWDSGIIYFQKYVLDQY